MSAFKEIYDRVREVTGARTQIDLARVLDIRQSSISDAKRRDSVPADWYMKLFDKFGINPDWLKKGVGPRFLRPNPDDYIPAEASGGLSMEEPAPYGSTSMACSRVLPVYGCQCHYEEDQDPPLLDEVGRIALPPHFAGKNIVVLRMDSDAFYPFVRKGAYLGIDKSANHPISGEVFAVFMPHEGLVLKRLFLDSAQGCFLLRSDNPNHLESRISAAACAKRLLGRVTWVLQML